MNAWEDDITVCLIRGILEGQAEPIEPLVDRMIEQRISDNDIDTIDMKHAIYPDREMSRLVCTWFGLVFLQMAVKDSMDNLSHV